MSRGRANHEGSIYRRKDGRWVGAVSLPNGKRKSFYGATREEVAQKLTSALKTVQDGLPVPSDQLTVERFLREWLQIAQHEIRPGTWRRYEQMVRLHAIPAIGRLKLSRLGPEHLQKLYADCLSKGLKPGTVRQIHAVLRRALGQAARWGTAPRNVATLVSPPRVPRRRMNPLTADESRRLLHAAQGHRLEAFLVLAITTGMRIGELQALLWQNVDLDRAWLQIEHTLTRTADGSVQLTEPKSARSRRRIALSPVAVEALRKHHRQQAEERLKLGSVWEDLDLVFANQRGRPTDERNFARHVYHPLLNQAGIPRRRFHDLRHTAATLSPATRGTRQDR
jgi:integrase